MIMNGLPYKEIAQAVGLSISTIKKLAATVKIRKKRPKPWEKLGISKATYYRRIKNTPPPKE
jgi:predicted DNA-binding transcriptional regulator AlpA